MLLFLEVSCLWEIMTDFAWCRNREVSLCVKRFSPFLCENNLENSLLGVVSASIVNTFFVWNIYNIKEKKTLQFCLALKIQEISKNFVAKEEKIVDEHFAVHRLIWDYYCGRVYILISQGMCWKHCTIIALTIGYSNLSRPPAKRARARCVTL